MSHAFSIRRLRVSGCLAELIQRIQSRRAGTVGPKTPLIFLLRTQAAEKLAVKRLMVGELERGAGHGDGGSVCVPNEKIRRTEQGISLPFDAG